MSGMATNGVDSSTGSCEGADRISDLQESVKRIEVGEIGWGVVGWEMGSGGLGLGGRLGFPVYIMRWSARPPCWGSRLILSRL